MKKHYQSFGKKGASDSASKLEALRIPAIANRAGPKRPLEGKTVLDLGCNEGFFCVEAAKLGATRVLGIDDNQKWIDLAQEHAAPGIEFRKESWWNLPDEKFDLIFFLSAIHYETDQKKLLDYVGRHLTPDGTLILECGVVDDAGASYWQEYVRGIGDVRRYPTHDLLVNGLLEGFASRFVGPSVKQSGDPVPRYVYHCTPRAALAILVAAPPGRGKSTFARDMDLRGLPSFSTDRFLQRAMRKPEVLGDDLHKTLQKQFPKRPHNMGEIGKYLTENHFETVSTVLLNQLPVELSQIVVEGHLLTHEKMTDFLKSELEARNVRVWRMTR